MAKRSYYKEAQSALKVYKAAGYTNVKLNASTEVLDEALKAIVKLSGLDFGTVFFHPETTLEVLKTVEVKEVEEQETKTTVKQLRAGQAVQKIRQALKKAFPGVKFLVKTKKIPGHRYTNTVFIGWYEGIGVTETDVQAIAKTYYSDLDCSIWFNDGSFA